MRRHHKICLNWVLAQLLYSLQCCGIFALIISVYAQHAAAQTANINRNVQREQLNRDAVMLVSGRPDSTMMKVADDLAIALNDQDGPFRIVPVVGDGAEGNVRDLILLRHVDMGITDLTVLEKMKKFNDLSQMLQREIAHVVTLFPDKLQILARKNIASIKDLEGKQVSAGFKNGGPEIHAKAIFDAFGVRVSMVNLPAADSAEALASGAIDAFVCFCLRSPEVYQRVMFNADLHLLPIPFESDLQQDYLPAMLVHEEFPSFIAKDESVNTIAVMLAIITYNWDRGSPRYARVATFVEKFFEKLPKLQESPRHPGWRSVQISATAEGWPRFAAAAEWQTAQRAQALQQMRLTFNEFLDRYSSDASATVESNDQSKLFEEFLAWRRSVQ